VHKSADSIGREPAAATQGGVSDAVASASGSSGANEPRFNLAGGSQGAAKFADEYSVDGHRAFGEIIGDRCQRGSE